MRPVFLLKERQGETAVKRQHIAYEQGKGNPHIKEPPEIFSVAGIDFWYVFDSEKYNKYNLIKFFCCYEGGKQVLRESARPRTL